MRGTLRQRAKGTWTIQVYLGEDPVTKKKRYLARTVKGTKRQAELALAKLIQAVETGMDFDSGRITVAEYLDRWVAASERNLRPKTVERYKELVRVHVAPVIGSIKLEKLQPLHLERVYQEVLAKGDRAKPPFTFIDFCLRLCGRRWLGNFCTETLPKQSRRRNQRPRTSRR